MQLYRARRDKIDRRVATGEITNAQGALLLDRLQREMLGRRGREPVAVERATPES